MEQVLNKIPKYNIYEAYYIFIEENKFKNFNEITNIAMHEALLKRFTHSPELIEEALSFEMLKELKKLARDIQKKGYAEISASILFDHYREWGMFLISSFSYSNQNIKVTMPENIVSYLLNLKIDDALLERDLFRKFVFGLLEVYGVILFDDIYRIYKAVRPLRFQSLSMKRLKDYEFLKDELLYEEVRVFQDALMHPIVEDFYLDIDPHIPKALHDFESYLYYASLRVSGKVYEKHKEDEKSNVFKNNINIFVQPCIEQFQGDIKKIKDVFGDGKYNDAWPLWHFGGRLISDVLKEEKLSIH